MKQVAAVSTVPLVLVGGPLVGFFIGDWLDARFGFQPYGKLVLILLGLAASVREIVQIIRKILNSQK